MYGPVFEFNCLFNDVHTGEIYATRLLWLAFMIVMPITSPCS